MKKVLILGVAAVQQDAMEVLKEMGCEVHAIARKKDGPGADEADFFEEIDFLDEAKVIQYIKEKGIHCVYSTGSDLAMPVAARVSEKLGLPFFVSERTARICNNKDLMRQTLGEDFPGNIPFQILRSKEETLQLQYPIILKPADSQGQRGVYRIEDEEGFRRHFQEVQGFTRSGQVIAEYFVKGPEVSVNGYVVDGELRLMEVSDRRTWSKYTGLIHKHIVPTKTMSRESLAKLHDILSSLVTKLTINNGPIYVQAKVMAGEPYVIEVTPRLDGCHMWRAIQRHRGVNLMKLTFEHLLFGNTKELDKSMDDLSQGLEVEFLCQKPHEPAEYAEFQDLIDQADFSFLYYKEGEHIRPVNGKYEKIGYVMSPDTGHWPKEA